MGLDNYWSLKNSDKEHPKFSPELNLCSGIFSSDGAKSFRGKVYSPFFEEEFGVTLYQEEISPKDIREISEKLKIFIEENAAHDRRLSRHLENQEVNDLLRMFEAYAELNATLIGWW